MRKLILVAHTSLDCFVGAPNGDLSWFPGGEESLQFVCGLTENADAALFGRKSFQLLDQYWPAAKDKAGASKGEIAYSNWYNSVTKIVLSTTIQPGENEKVIVIGENAIDQLNTIKQKDGEDILIFGSPKTTEYLMRHDCIDEYWIFINPILFGEGIALFSRSDHRTALRMVAAHQIANGEVAIHYEVKHQS